MELQRRARALNDKEERPGPVIYWMSRDQRLRDNSSLLFAQEKALKDKRDLIVIFSIPESSLKKGAIQFDFMIKGLQLVISDLKNYNIPFHLLSGIPDKEIPDLIKSTQAGILVTDFEALKPKRLWKKRVAEKINIRFYEVDAHNIIPCWITSTKLEFGAYTIRPKISRLLPEYLEDYSKVKIMPGHNLLNFLNDNGTKLNEFNKPKAAAINPGESAALKSLYDFLNNKIDLYATDRNDPNKQGQSGLSAYLHFGHISAQRIALEVEKNNFNIASKEAFLEELITRKELSDNFCYYNFQYNSFEGFPDWAKNTLNKHRSDKREYVYSTGEFEKAQTHENLWNSAQTEMIRTGKMHGYMRMYWAKKILEWSASPEDALKTALYLNDKYQLDGMDPNGYAGCAWSIGGTHDRAWSERPVLGKIRYMNLNGAKRKFDVEQYIKSNSLPKLFI
jgi:deoxyribodipyrimidine photo-lyase